MGELVCPDCNNVMARLFDAPDGIAVSAWIPAAASAPGDPNGRRVGWTFFAMIDDSMPDEESAPLKCWRGHDHLVVTARDCRTAAAAYRSTGRKKRVPLSPMGPDTVR
ncbi:hypothetical protein ACFTWM_03075 [Streptomyces bacillaris]|uniref:hypothetical protein n=1 Tax=Streptomyces bacillaris TaxID=68179 RepID=UPI0036254D8B